MHRYLRRILEYSQPVGATACFGGIAGTSHVAIAGWSRDRAPADCVATEAFLRIFCSGYCILLTTAVCDASLVGHLRAISIVIAR